MQRLIVIKSWVFCKLLKMLFFFVKPRHYSKNIYNGMVMVKKYLVTEGSGSSFQTVRNLVSF